MARLAYLHRVAYGRSSHEHPPRDDPTVHRESSSAEARAREASTSNAIAESKEAEDIVPLYTDYVQRYNERGHPFNPESRLYGRAMRTAANDVLSVIGIVEKSDNLDPAERRISESRVTQASDVENVVGDSIAAVGVIILDGSTWWLGGFVARLLTFPPQRDLSLVDIMSTQYQAIGPWAFLFAGLPSFRVTSFFGPPFTKTPLLYQVDRLVMATVSTRSMRLAYTNWIRPPLAGLIDFTHRAIMFSFRHHSAMQTLGFIPFGFWTVLPHWRTLVPFAYDHPLKLGATSWPILALFVYQQVIADTIYDKISEWVDNSGILPSEDASNEKRHRRSPSEQSLIPSQNQQSGRSAFASTAWARFRSVFQSSPSSSNVQQRPTGHSAQREEDQDDMPSVEAGATPNSRITQLNVSYDPSGNLPTTVSEIDAGNVDQDDMRDNDDDDGNDTAERTTPDSPSIPSTTIRISGYDSNSGMVNLEIGVPEEVETSLSAPLSNHEPVSPNNDHDPTINRIMENDAHVFGYHVSSLSTITAPMFSFVINNFFADLALMPFRTVLLRRLAAYYIYERGLAVAPGYTAGLWTTPAPWTGSRTRALGGIGAVANYGQKIVLCYSIDMAFGLAFTSAEWLLIRWVGTRWFNWGGF